MIAVTVKNWGTNIWGGGTTNSLTVIEPLTIRSLDEKELGAVLNAE